MTRYLLSILPLVALTLINSCVDAFSFNLTMDDRMNGHIINPATDLKLEGASQSCLKAFVADVDCDVQLFYIIYGSSFESHSNANLTKTCSPKCESAVARWILNSFDACKDQPGVTEYNTTLATPDLYMLRFYRAYCTQDLNNGTFCVNEMNPVALQTGVTYSSAEKAAACKDTCFTQQSAVFWKTYSEFNQTSQIPVQNVADVCPALDTSKYKIITPLSQLAASNSASSSATTSDSNTVTSTSVGTTATAATKTTGSASSQTSGVKATTTPNMAGSLSSAPLSIALALFALALAL